MKNKAGIIGLGYVGLPLAIAFADAGISVTGFDVDENKPKSLHEGKSYLRHIKDEEIRELNNKGFEATTDFSRLADMELLAVCVPTPLDGYNNPDLSFVLDTTSVIAEHLQKGQIIVLESTTYPGTTREEVLPILEKTGLKVGQDFYLAFSPEREDPGREDYKGGNMPRVIGGITSDCLEKACDYYERSFSKMVRVSNPEEAEMTKLLENIYRSVNIALVNELKVIADRMGVNIWEVIEAASSKPFGFQPFFPGPGLGGHCIPIDPFYLSYKAKEYDLVPRFIELAGEVNTNMPYWVILKTMEAMNEQGKALKNSRVLLIGLAYKKDVDDLRESPAFKVWELMEKKGARVDYYDPYIPKSPKTRKYDYTRDSIKFTAEKIREYDVAVILADHSVIDYEFLCENSKLVIDTRNATKKVPKRDNIVLA